MLNRNFLLLLFVILFPSSILADKSQIVAIPDTIIKLVPPKDYILSEDLKGFEINSSVLKEKGLISYRELNESLSSAISNWKKYLINNGFVNYDQKEIYLNDKRAIFFYSENSLKEFADSESTESSDSILLMINLMFSHGSASHILNGTCHRGSIQCESIEKAMLTVEIK